MQQANIINMITNKYAPQQKHRLGTVSKKGFLTHQWIITGNKQITDKYYDETKMRTRQKQRVATDTWRSLGCRTTPLEHWSKRKPTVEPRWAKQQTKKVRPQPTEINSFM